MCMDDVCCCIWIVLLDGIDDLVVLVVGEF